MGAAFDGDKLEVVDQRGQPLGRRLERENPILGAVHDQGGDVDLRQVGRKSVSQVSTQAWLAYGEPPAATLEARLPGLLADPVPHQLVDVVEVVEEALEVRIAVLTITALIWSKTWRSTPSGLCWS